MKTEANKQVITYLTFRLGEEEYGTPVSDVLNILELLTITEVPHAPAYMKGVINLRGMVLPVIDTRIKFGMTETVDTEKTCIIVLDLKQNNGELLHVGILVDQVVAVMEIEPQQIEPPPTLGNLYNTTYITGVARMDERLIMLLDMYEALSPDEISTQNVIQA